MAANQNDKKPSKAWLATAISGVILGIILILGTIEIAHRNIVPFVTAQQRYIVSAEAAFLGIFIVEVLVTFVSYNSHFGEMVDVGLHLRLVVRIAGYLIVGISVISMLGSNPTLAISVGTVAGVVVAFATQNIVGSLLSTILILNTHIIRVGEEITIGAVRGTVVDINLIHTIISIEDDIVFVPNSAITSSSVRRKRRPPVNIGLKNW